MSAYHLLPLIRETVQAFSLHYQEAMQPVLNRHGFRNGDWLRVFFAYGLDPEPLTTDLMQVMLPFNSENTNKRSLAAATEHGLLEQLNENSFQLAEAGRRGIAAFYQATGQAIAELTPISIQDMNHLAALLQRVVMATVDADVPFAPRRLLMSRQSDPGS